MVDMGTAAGRVTREILADLRSERHLGVVVDSPPGAGKSTLVVRAAMELAAAGAPLMVVAQTNEQVDDLVVRLSSAFAQALPGALIGRLSRWDPMQSAVAVLLRNNPTLPVHRLPVSWRLPVTAEHVIAEAFYPFSGFRSGTGPGERGLRFTTRGFGNDPVDAVLASAAGTGWGLLELPAGYTIRTDAEAVDTANRLQGREYEVTVVLHPLSGRRDATAFHLEAGRLCVLTSRHRQACIVVARAGIRELLDAHPVAEPVHLHEPVKFPDGWAANQTMMASS